MAPGRCVSGPVWAGGRPQAAHPGPRTRGAHVAGGDRCGTIGHQVEILTSTLR